jgi:hypothetical protein
MDGDGQAPGEIAQAAVSDEAAIGDNPAALGEIAR